MTPFHPRPICTLGVLTTIAKDIFHSAYHAELLSGIFHRIGRLRHALKIVTWPPKSYASSLDTIFQEHQLDGLLILTWRWIHPHLARLIETTQHDRVVIFNDPVPGIRVHCLFTDIEFAIEQAVAHLVKKRHHKIGMIHGPKNIIFKNHEKKTKLPFVDTLLKKSGFLKALRKRNIKIKPSWVREASANSKAEGYQVMKKWLREKNLPEAILCGNDDLALGALTALKEKGISVPENLAVIGFDDISQAGHFIPPLTTLRQPLVQMGSDAVDLLMERIRCPGLPVVFQKYSPHLVIRKTA